MWGETKCVVVGTGKTVNSINANMLNLKILFLPSDHMKADYKHCHYLLIDGGSWGNNLCCEYLSYKINSLWYIKFQKASLIPTMVDDRVMCLI